MSRPRILEILTKKKQWYIIKVNDLRLTYYRDITHTLYIIYLTALNST